jgi:hypothetical protein
MLKQQIIELQTYLKVEADGFWGPQSTEAAQKHLRKLMASAPPSPKTDQASLTAAYGAAGDESNLVNLSVEGLGVKYDGKPVKTVRCNKVVALSLKLIIQELATFPEGVAVLAQYGGVYNNRPMRGGSTPSLHARGAAIDLAPDTNANKQHWPVSANMSFKVMEVFAKHGWLAAGAFWSRDAMHFQKTQ